MNAEAETLQVRAEPAETSRAAGLYDRDFARWALREAALIRAGRFGEIDVENLAEEVASLGREQFRTVKSHLRVLLVHLLKWDYQPELRTRSWTLSIREARDQVEGTVEDSPSLKRRRQDALTRAYRSARIRAALETDLPLASFPEEFPYSLGEVMNRLVLWADD